MSISISPDEMERISSEVLENERGSTENTSPIILPNMENNTEDQLLTSGIVEEIQSESLNNVLVDETDEIKAPSYLIDMSEICITKASFTAIKGLLAGGGTHVYILDQSGKIHLIGSGDDYVLYTVLENILRVAFGDKCKLYKNNGKGFKPLEVFDVTSVRLNL